MLRISEEGLKKLQVDEMANWEDEEKLSIGLD